MNNTLQKEGKKSLRKGTVNFLDVLRMNEGP